MSTLILLIAATVIAYYVFIANPKYRKKLANNMHQSCVDADVVHGTNFTSAALKPKRYIVGSHSGVWDYLVFDDTAKKILRIRSDSTKKKLGNRVYSYTDIRSCKYLSNQTFPEIQFFTNDLDEPCFIIKIGKDGTYNRLSILLNLES